MVALRGVEPRHPARASRSRCSARPAPGSPRCSACSAECSAPRPARCSSTATTSPGSARASSAGCARARSPRCCRARAATCCPTRPPRTTSTSPAGRCPPRHAAGCRRPPSCSTCSACATSPARRCSRMSGGERQRVAFAAAVSSGAGLLLRRRAHLAAQPRRPRRDARADPPGQPRVRHHRRAGHPRPRGRPRRCRAASPSATAGSAPRAGTASTSASSTRTAPCTSPTTWPSGSPRARWCSSRRRPTGSCCARSRARRGGAPVKDAAGRAVGPARTQRRHAAGHRRGGHRRGARPDVRPAASRAPRRHADRRARAVHHRAVVLGPGVGRDRRARRPPRAPRYDAPGRRSLVDQAVEAEQGPGAASHWRPPVRWVLDAGGVLRHGGHQFVVPLYWREGMCELATGHRPLSDAAPARCWCRRRPRTRSASASVTRSRLAYTDQFFVDRKRGGTVVARAEVERRRTASFTVVGTYRIADPESPAWFDLSRFAGIEDLVPPPASLGAGGGGDPMAPALLTVPETMHSQTFEGGVGPGRSTPAAVDLDDLGAVEPGRGAVHGARAAPPPPRTRSACSTCTRWSTEVRAEHTLLSRVMLAALAPLVVLALLLLFALVSAAAQVRRPYVSLAKLRGHSRLQVLRLRGRGAVPRRRALGAGRARARRRRGAPGRAAVAGPGHPGRRVDGRLGRARRSWSSPRCWPPCWRRWR